MNVRKLVASITSGIFCFAVSACFAQDAGVNQKKNGSAAGLLRILAPDEVESTRKEIKRGKDSIEVVLPSLPGRAIASNLATVGSYMVLECRNSNINFYINWQEKVGQKGKKRRHYFFEIGGDNHIPLSVLDDNGMVTGYINESPKAKAVLSRLLRNLIRDKDRDPDLAVATLPSGPNQDEIRWIDIFIPAKDFKNAVSTVAKYCNWDIQTAVKEEQPIVDEVPGGRSEID